MCKKYRKIRTLFIYAFTARGLCLAQKIVPACLFEAREGESSFNLPASIPVNILANIPTAYEFDRAVICAPNRILKSEKSNVAGAAGAANVAGAASPHTVNLRGFSAINELMEDTFLAGEAHVFISACGIAVRAIAPFLQNKEKDPAVIVLDQAGKHVISLLSGHLGGGNALACKIADVVDGEPIITTATDVEGVAAVDTFFAKYNLKPVNREKIKDINSALLEGEHVFLEDSGKYLQELYDNEEFKKFYMLEHSPLEAPGQISVSFKKTAGVGDACFEKTLILAPPVLYVGVGCRKGVAGKKLIEFVESVFKEHGLYTKAIAGFATAMIKENEEGLRELADYFNVPIAFFEHDQLNACSFLGHSPKALSEFGLKGVCEPAALLAAKANNLLLSKVTGEGMTLAVAVSSTIHFNSRG